WLSRWRERPRRGTSGKSRILSIRQMSAAASFGRGRCRLAARPPGFGGRRTRGGDRRNFARDRAPEYPDRPEFALLGRPSQGPEVGRLQPDQGWSEADSESRIVRPSEPRRTSLALRGPGCHAHPSGQPDDGTSAEVTSRTFESRVAVGNALAGVPPRRSVRAELPHTAPTSGDGGVWAKPHPAHDDGGTTW